MNRQPSGWSGILATWFGCGYFPWGPGTAGSLAAVLMAAAAHSYWNAGRWAFLAATLILLLPSIQAATLTARQVGREDPGIVVVDEVLGVWTTLLGAIALNWKSFTTAFFLFRLFDIWKPWPVRRLENLPGGLGIIADDLAAGVMAAVILYIGGVYHLY